MVWDNTWVSVLELTGPGKGEEGAFAQAFFRLQASGFSSSKSLPPNVA